MTFKAYLEEQPVKLRQRAGRSRAMIRSSNKIQFKRAISAKKRAPLKKLMLRAEKQARTLLQKHFAGQDYMSLSQTEKIAIDRKINGKKLLLKQVAKKLLPKVKEAEEKRLENLKQKAAENA